MVRHPVLLVGLAVTLFGIVSLPAQYTPVLFDHDAEFVMLACAALPPATSIAAYRDALRRANGHLRRALIAGGVTTAICAAAIGYMRAIGGIGWPRPFVLLGIVGVVAVVTLAGSVLGASRVHGLVRVPAIAATAVVAAIGLVIGAAELNLARSRPAGDGHCEQRRTVRYCFYDGYEPFVQKWARPVEAVLANVPPSARPAEVLIRQSDEHVPRPADVAAAPHLGWDDSGSATAELALALDVANALIGIRSAEGADKCGAPAARSVVLWWLAAQVDTRGRRDVAQMARDDPFADAVSGSDYAAPLVPDVMMASALASQLLDRDDDAVRQYLWSEWRVLVDPATGPDVLVDHFGLEPVSADTLLPCD